MTELLYANSAIGRRDTQLFCSRSTKARRYASIVWLRRSVCPSVCGWKAVDIHGRIASSPRNSFQVSEVNRESRSDTMSVGDLWNLHTSRANIFVRSDADFSQSGMKCAILVNLSMITQSWLHPSDSGNSVMKSMAIDCHGA